MDKQQSERPPMRWMSMHIGSGARLRAAMETVLLLLLQNQPTRHGFGVSTSAGNLLLTACTLIGEFL